VPLFVCEGDYAVDVAVAGCGFEDGVGICL